MSNENLSHRSMMAAAVAVAAVPAAVAGIAITPSLANVGAPVGDAKLLKLGAVLDRVSRDWLAQRATDAWEEANDVSTDLDLERWGHINDRLFRLANKILAHKATTPAGIGVQTQAIALVFSELWEDERDTDDDHTWLRLFIESVSSCLGISLVPVHAAVAREAVQS
jgi:hypothetical protein